MTVETDSGTLDELIGLTLTSVQYIEEGFDGNDLVVFQCGDREWRMGHRQDCCENVRIKQIDGELSDLVGVPIQQAEWVTNYNDESNDYGGDEEWTFYKFGTAKGYVTISWLGESSGYYSVSVGFGSVEK